MLTVVHRIIHVTQPITGFDLSCSLVLTGEVHRVTGGVPVDHLGLFKRFTTTIKSLTGVTGGFGALDRVRR